MAVELLQGNFDNVPLALDTSNVAAIEVVSLYTTVQRVSPSLTPLTLLEDWSTLTWQQLTTLSLSLCATARESLRTTTSV